ncbi:MAG: excinuclease ABC subunit UvrA [Chloroflexi bacterium]|nr:excinuclease ABC subunit UvrA [Chloroflexota bacterium]
MPQENIVVRGARVHNLKNVNVEIPRDKLVVITGLSGSGKSSLAFDTIFAEGQRRYVESLSAYARQFLGQMEKPDVDQIEGLSPAVSIDQKGSSHNPRSTVGTVTEIYDYLRLMFARIGVQYSPVTGQPLQSQNAEMIVDQVAALTPSARVQVLAPLIKDKKGHHQGVFDDIRKQGFVRARVNGQIVDVNQQNQEIELDRYKLHNIEAVVDRLVVPASDAVDDERAQFVTRLTDSVETALKLGDGFMIAMVQEPTAAQPSGDGDVPVVATFRDVLFSEKKVDPATGISYPDLEPKLFSFNAPQGACPECQGLGARREIDPARVIPNPDLTLDDGAINAGGWNSDDDESWGRQVLQAVCAAHKIPLNKPWRQLTNEQHEMILHGAKGDRYPVTYVNRMGERRRYEVQFEGVVSNLMRRYRESSSDYVKHAIEELMTFHACETCGGKRLKPEVLAVRIAGAGIADVSDMSIGDALAWIDSLGIHADEAVRKAAAVQLSERDRKIAAQIVKEIRARLGFLVDVGLDYLTLSRSATTLSGGESQRIRLATQVGSQLMGVLYVLDEPSIGLHQRDQERLIRTLTRMRDLGNTVLVVEHDDDTMKAADYIIDMGLGAGEHGGNVIAVGTPSEIMKHKVSLTGAYLSGRKHIPVPEERRAGNGKLITIRNARENNLKGIDVDIPLGKLVVVTGVSGSGKSSLIVECLYKALANQLNGALERWGALDEITGIDALDKVINIDQQPIGRTPRSNPATYTGLWTPLRDLFAVLPESKTRGYKSGRFSFNVKGGRCEACEGQGVLQIQMQFMPDIYVTCDSCHGTRFNRETLQVRYKGKNIAEVLDMTITEGIEFFKDIPSIARKLETLIEVGLGYVKLGQPATTLSGGEAQRVKLSRELSKRATGRTIYVLDEPSVGLHAADVHKLIQVINRLVDDGNTVVVIEHHLDIIKVADWLIDLGPEGGMKGGYVVAQGTPEEIAAHANSHTGRFLRPALERDVSLRSAPVAPVKAGKARKKK